MPKVVAFPQQRLASVDRQGIGDAIAEVQSRGVAAAIAEICVCPAGQVCLMFGHRFDDEIGFADEVVEASANDRVTLGVQDYPAFEVANCRQSARVSAVAIAAA